MNGYILLLVISDHKHARVREGTRDLQGSVDATNEINTIIFLNHIYT